jgi:hypothetical protein
MNGLLAATEPARTIVVERGGPAWWIPFATALFVATVAALASYYATWRFKRADVNRENAVQARDLVDDAERIASSPDRYREGGGAKATSRLLQQALIRAQPIDDWNLFDDFFAAQDYNFRLQQWDEPPNSARYWLGEAIAQVRQALVPYLSAPRLFRGAKLAKSRSFPTFDEMRSMPSDDRDPQKIVDALVDWRAKQG